MNMTVENGPRTGRVSVPSSKSQLHRLLICAALSDKESVILTDGISVDINATMDCLNALGAAIRLSDRRIEVQPIGAAGQESGERHLYCRESGSTLRFLLPLCGALGVKAVFHREGRLSKRPLEDLVRELTRHGMEIWEEEALLHCAGSLRAGSFSVPGNISSQYISGLLFALPLLTGGSTLTVTGEVESESYIRMTEEALKQAGIRYEREGWQYRIPGSQQYACAGKMQAEKDWSSAAFFLVMGAFSEKGITLTGMNPASAQSDKAILSILTRFGAEVLTADDTVMVRKKALSGITIDAANVPDLVPVLAVLAAGAAGTTEIIHAERLRIKESDRLAASCRMLTDLGAEIEETADGLVIRGKKQLKGGEVSSFKDHRIAMAAAAAASLCEEPVTIDEAECTEKSYPGFFDDLQRLLPK